MRRSHRSTIVSFLTGVLWSGAAAATFIVLLQVSAPPVTEDDKPLTTASSPSLTGTLGAALERWVPSHRLLAPSEAAAEEPARPDPAALAPPAPRLVREGNGVEAQRVLTRSIQQELRRVACYAGPIDGAWSEGTRSAMLAFNEVVNARLPVAAPDYILLTMLQGHGNRACAPPSPATVAGTRTPVPSRHSAAARDATPRQPAGTGIVISAPAAQPAPAQAAPAVTTSITSWTAEVVPPTLVRPPTIAAPLPGRMAVGAPLAPPSSSAVSPSAHGLESRDAALAALPAANPAAGTVAVEPPRQRDPRAAQAQAASRTSAPSPRAAGRQPSERGRSGGLFADLNRSAP